MFMMILAKSVEHCSWYWILNARTHTYSFLQDLKNTGVCDLLMYYATKFAQTKTQVFDFEGSMMQNIVQSYSISGTMPIQYFHVYKISNTLLGILNNSKPIY